MNISSEVHSSIIHPNNTCYAICPKCSQFPLFQFKFERPIKIKIKCECGYNQILLLKKYLSLLSTHSCSSLHNQSCSIHNKEFKYYLEMTTITEQKVHYFYNIFRES